MKTKHLTLTLATVATAALTSFTANAIEPLLSPRAADNQTRTLPGPTEDRLHRGLPNGSPRGREQQMLVVAGGTTGPNLALRPAAVTASPRAFDTFPWLAQPVLGPLAPSLVGTPATQ